MVKLHYFGHACFLFEDNDNLFLMDPWLSIDGAFLGSWRQMDIPEGSLKKIISISKNKKLNILISHEHEDHYDFDTLNKLKKYINKIIIPKYQGRYFYNKLNKNLDIKIIELEEQQILFFDKTEIQLFIDESGINRDAGFHIKNINLNFLNLNDCKLNDRVHYIKKMCGKIDVFTCQFSGANMHPHTYKYEINKIEKIANRKIKSKFFSVNKMINTLNPSIYIPSAGPPLFSPKELENCNNSKNTIFPKWWDFQVYLEKKKTNFNFINLRNNTSIEFSKNKIVSDIDHSKKFSISEINNIVEKYRSIEDKKAYKQFSKLEIHKFVKEEFRKKLTVLNKFKNIFNISLNFYLFIDKEYVFGFEKIKLNEIEKFDHPEQDFYIHYANSKTLNRLMNSSSSWGTYFLSLMFTNHRVPDIYDSILNLYLISNTDEELEYGLENEELELGLKKLESIKDNKELIDIKSSDGKKIVTCQRYCPHQGADLTYAEFDGRYITCPRHSWKFDVLNDGLASNSTDKVLIKCIKDR